MVGTNADTAEICIIGARFNRIRMLHCSIRQVHVIILTAIQGDEFLKDRPIFQLHSIVPLPTRLLDGPDADLRVASVVKRCHHVSVTSSFRMLLLLLPLSMTTTMTFCSDVSTAVMS